MQERRFAIGYDGAVVKINSPFLRGWEKVDTLDQLLKAVDHPLRNDIVVETVWVGVKFPAEELKRILGTIHEFPNMETGYVLCYNFSDNTWKAVCPEQAGSGASTHFEAVKLPEGYAEVGTIHTHPNMGAFWSGTDLHDFKDTPGIYVVFGLENGKPAHTLCSVFRNNHRYDQDLWDVFEEVDLQGDYEPDKEWVETIKKQCYQRREDPLEALRRKFQHPTAEADETVLRWADIDGDSARPDRQLPYGIGYSGSWPRRTTYYPAYDRDRQDDRKPRLPEAEEHLDWLLGLVLSESSITVDEAFKSLKRVGNDCDIVVTGGVLDSSAWPEDVVEPITDVLSVAADVLDETEGMELRLIVEKINRKLAASGSKLGLTVFNEKQVKKLIGETFKANEKKEETTEEKEEYTEADACSTSM